MFFIGVCKLLTTTVCKHVEMEQTDVQVNWRKGQGIIFDSPQVMYFV